LLNNNFIPKFAKCQGGGRQTALLPQKTRSIYSYNQLKKALSEGLWSPAAVPVSRFQFFVEKDGEKRPVGAFAGSDPRTIEFYLELARKNNWAVLYQGTILITRKTAEELRENRRTAKGDWEKITQLDQQALFGKEVVRLAYRVLIDIDKKDEVAIRKLVKYLLKLKVYPEVWETKDGYHLYFYFYYSKVYQEIKVIDEDGKERVEKVLVGYTLPYADDYRIKDVEECLKVLCAKLRIQPDIVSAKHAVWLEGVPNPLKDGFATKLVFTGFPLPLQDLWKKLLKVNPAKVRQKVRQNKPRYYRKRKPKQKDTDNAEETRWELKNLLSGEHSSVFHALNQHGTLIACRKLWKAGYGVPAIRAELEKHLKIRKGSGEKYLQKFLDYFEKNYTKSTNKKESPLKEEEQKKEEPKHEHYWELAEKVKEALEKGYRKTTHIAQYVGCSRDRVKHFKSFLNRHGYKLEDLLTRYEEVLAFLKAHAKGGNKWQRKREWDREAWLEDFHRKEAEYIKQCKREAEIRRAKKRAELKEQGIDPDGWVHAPVWFLPVKSGHIGDIRVCFSMAAVGYPLTNRPLNRKNKTRKKDPYKTPAVPLVLPKSLTSSLQDSLFDLLKQHHSEDGLPVVLVVPRRVSSVRRTILQLTPYKVPPGSFKQLWKEIKERFGKLVQGLSTKNGALDWFLRVWEEFKEEIMVRGWVSVGSSPSPFKEDSPSSGRSKQLSDELSTHQEKPSNKLTERTENETTPTEVFQAPPDKLEPMPQRSERTLGEMEKPVQEHETEEIHSNPQPTSCPTALTSGTSSSGQDTLTSSTHTQEEFEKETEEEVELTASNEGILSTTSWEDLLRALVDGELSEEELNRILFATEKEKGITLRGVLSVVRKLREKVEKLKGYLQEGKLQEAEKLLERINKDLQDLEEGTRNAVGRRGVKHSPKKLTAILLKLNDFSLKQFGVPFIYGQKEMGKFMKLLDKALDKYLIVSGYDLEKDFQTILKAFLETYAYTYLRFKPTRERFLMMFVDYRNHIRLGLTSFRDTIGRTLSIEEIKGWVESHLEQTKSVPGFPSSQVVQIALKFLEGRTQSSDVVKVSREELKTAIYLAWREVDKGRANKKAVSEYIDRFEGILWRKLPGGYYGLLVGSDKVRARIRDYVLELKQAKKNGQPPTNGTGSVGSELLTHNGNNGNGKPSARGNGSVGSTSQPSNGNGKYDIDQIIHTLEEKGSVVVPPQFVYEIVRELRRRGLSVKYWPATGLIELVGGDDEIPF